MAKQTGSEYREKNRIRLQRFYERQAASGKKRVSALVSDEAYRLLINQKEQSGESMSTLIDQAVMVAYGQQDIPDVDDVSEDFLAAYGGPDPETPSDETPVSATTTDQADDTLAPAIDDTAGPDQAEPAALVDQEADTTNTGQVKSDQTDGQDTARAVQIPDCKDLTLTLDERDSILLAVEKAMPDMSQAQDRVDLLNERSVPVNTRSSKHRVQWDKKKFRNNLRLAKQRIGDQDTDSTTDDTALVELNPPEKNTAPEIQAADDTIATDAQVEDGPDTAQMDVTTDDPVNTPVGDTVDQADDALGDKIPDCKGRKITREERDKILVQAVALLPGKENAQKRVDLLNRKSIPVYVDTRQYPYGGEWDRKKFTDNLRLAMKRLGIK